MIVVLICADIEWKILLRYFPSAVLFTSLLGEWFESKISSQQVVFFHGGWGKIHSASSTQYCIEHWQPSLVINLGTCGGIQGRSTVGELILAARTIVYDIFEQMGDPQEAIQFYTTTLDLYGLELSRFPQLRHATIVSADRDLAAAELEDLVIIMTQ
jgi:adenosylhomocysteine nucleosidase